MAQLWPETHTHKKGSYIFTDSVALSPDTYLYPWTAASASTKIEHSKYEFSNEFPNEFPTDFTTKFPKVEILLIFSRSVSTYLACFARVLNDTTVVMKEH